MVVNEKLLFFRRDETVNSVANQSIIEDDELHQNSDDSQSEGDYGHFGIRSSQISKQNSVKKTKELPLKSPEHHYSKNWTTLRIARRGIKQ